MAKGAKKGRCPRCGGKMRLNHRFCMKCGGPNPLLVPSRRRAAAPKSAGSSYAPVADFRTAQMARLWAEHRSEPDPARRQGLVEMIMKSGGIA